ncbi:hypothetical protein NKG94_26540 [Micromonospora sp. M12]
MPRTAGDDPATRRRIGQALRDGSTDDLVWTRWLAGRPGSESVNAGCCGCSRWSPSPR